VANSVTILDRLVGLETEYAIRFHPREEGAPSPSRFHLYQALIARLKRHVLTAPARHIKEGLFWPMVVPCGLRRNGRPPAED